MKEDHLCLLPIYIPPSTSSEILSEYLDALSLCESVVNKDVMIVGDFNCPKFIIDDQHSRGIEAMMLSNFIVPMDLNEFNFIQNSLGRLLDLVLCELNCEVVRYTCGCPKNSLEFILSGILAKLYLILD